MRAPDKVAVVMPVRNGRAYLANAVESILGQTYSGFRFIIVDDGSEDSSAAEIDAYAKKDNRIRLLRQAPGGVAKALNRGIGATDADLIVRMDADDIAVPERLETQLRYLDDNPEVSVVGSFVRIIGAGGKVRKIKRFPVGSEQIKRRMMVKNPICHSSVVMRRMAYEKAGGYDERFLTAQDHDLWLRMSAREAFANLPVPLLNYRDHGQQVTDRSNAQRSCLFSALAILSHLFAKYGLPRPPVADFTTLDFRLFSDRLGDLFDAVREPRDRACLYYQTARLFRYYSNRTGMDVLSRLVAQRAIVDGKATYMLRRAFYRFF